jgi:phosphoglycolate phosphatase-like HAD superfamily hydrolase
VSSFLGATEIRAFFHEVRCGNPDKEGLLREIVGAENPKNFLMVGDMRKDWTAARSCGIASIGACYGYCVRETAEFDFYINTPMELLAMVETCIF